MPFMPAEPITQPTYQSMQFDGTAADAMEIVGAIDSGLAGNLLVRGSAEGFREGDTVHWRIRLQRPDDGIPEMVADAGAWIVVVSTGAIRVLSDAEYRAEFNVTGA